MSAATPRKSLLYESLLGVAGLFILAIPAWWVARSFDVGAKLVFAGALVVFVMMSGTAIVFALSTAALESDLKKDISKGDTGDFHLVGLPILLIASFLLASFTMWRIWGAKAFTGASLSVNDWLLYLLDNLVRSVLFDVAETFYLDISPIDQAHSFWPCAFVFLFRTVTSVGVIKVVLTTWVHLRRK